MNEYVVNAKSCIIGFHADGEVCAGCGRRWCAQHMEQHHGSTCADLAGLVREGYYDYHPHDTEARDAIKVRA